MRRSGNETFTTRISEDTLNDLYETAMVIKKNVEGAGFKSALFSSMDNREATLEAAVHIGHLLAQLKKKVLLVNLDPLNTNGIIGYLEPDKEAGLISQLRHSTYISESISRTQFENLDVLGIEEVSEEDFATVVNQYGLKSKLSPLTNYYDLMIVIGPEAETFNYYANIFELADCAVTIVNGRKNDREALKSHIGKLKVFNIRSFGIIRKDN